MPLTSSSHALSFHNHFHSFLLYTCLNPLGVPHYLVLPLNHSRVTPIPKLSQTFSILAQPYLDILWTALMKLSSTTCILDCCATNHQKWGDYLCNQLWLQLHSSYFHIYDYNYNKIRCNQLWLQLNVLIVITIMITERIEWWTCKLHTHASY